MVRPARFERATYRFVVWCCGRPGAWVAGRALPTTSATSALRGQELHALEKAQVRPRGGQGGDALPLLGRRREDPPGEGIPGDPDDIAPFPPQEQEFMELRGPPQ